MVEENLAYPTLEIEIGLKLNAIEKKSIQLRSESAFYNLTPSVPYFMHEKETCELQFQIDI